MLLVECSRHSSHGCQSSKVDRWSRYTISATFYSSGDIGSFSFGNRYLVVLTPHPVRYAFRSTEKAALQEIGPRFTLKLRWLKKGIPAVQNFGAPAAPLQLAADEPEGASQNDEPIVPPVTDEYEWQWRVSEFFTVTLSMPDRELRSRTWRQLDGRSFCDSILYIHSEPFQHVNAQDFPRIGCWK